MKSTMHQHNDHDLTPLELNKIDRDLNKLIGAMEDAIMLNPDDKNMIINGGILVAFQLTLWAEDMDQVKKYFNIT